jgi:hypothetical protein
MLIFSLIRYFFTENSAIRSQCKFPLNRPPSNNWLSCRWRFVLGICRVLRALRHPQKLSACSFIVHCKTKPVSCWSYSYQHYLFQSYIIRMGFFLEVSRLKIPTRDASLVCYVSRPSNYIVFNHLRNVWWVAQIMKHLNHYVTVSTSYSFLFVMPRHHSAVICSNRELPHTDVLQVSKETYFSVSRVSS